MERVGRSSGQREHFNFKTDFISLIEAACVFLSCPRTRYWFSIGSQAPVMLLLWGEGRSTCNGKMSVQINPWRVVDFFPDTFVSSKVPDILRTLFLQS